MKCVGIFRDLNDCRKQLARKLFPGDGAASSFKQAAHFRGRLVHFLAKYFFGQLGASRARIALSTARRFSHGCGRGESEKAGLHGEADRQHAGGGIADTTLPSLPESIASRTLRMTPIKRSL
jgi:hypothetical protein